MKVIDFICSHVDTYVICSHYSSPIPEIAIKSAFFIFDKCLDIPLTSVTMRINVNTANAEELKQIPGIGDKVAQFLIQFRDSYGVVKREALNLALRGNL